jgi:translation elongation factor EF-Ts
MLFATALTLILITTIGAFLPSKCDLNIKACFLPKRCSRQVRWAAVTGSSNRLKQLRDMTGAGLLSCKEALDQHNGDISKAANALMQSSVLKAAKKADRQTKCGVVAVGSSGDSAVALLKLTTESDFVARNIAFQSFASFVASNAPKWASAAGLELEDGNGSRDGQLLEAVLSSVVELAPSSLTHLLPAGCTVADGLVNMISVFGENMKLEAVRFVTLPSEAGGYSLHFASHDGSPRLGVGTVASCVVLQSSSEDTGVLCELGKWLCLHVISAGPADEDAAGTAMLGQEWGPQPGTSIQDLLVRYAVKLGSEVSFIRYSRMSC